MLLNMKCELEFYKSQRNLADRSNCFFFSQAYMQAKSKGAPVVEDPDPKGLRVPERRIDIQPAEDDEDPGTFLSFCFEFFFTTLNTVRVL